VHFLGKNNPFDKLLLLASHNSVYLIFFILVLGGYSKKKALNKIKQRVTNEKMEDKVKYEHFDDHLNSSSAAIV